MFLDFWKQKQKEDSESSLSSSPSPTNTIKRAGTIGIRPVIPPPSPKPQPDAVIEDLPAAPVVGQARGGSKKAPPPPPPKRSGSISRTSPAPHAMPTVGKMISLIFKLQTSFFDFQVPHYAYI